MIGVDVKQITSIIDTKTLFLSPLTLPVHYYFSFMILKKALKWK